MVDDGCSSCAGPALGYCWAGDGLGNGFGDGWGCWAGDGLGNGFGNGWGCWAGDGLEYGFGDGWGCWTDGLGYGFGDGWFRNELLGNMLGC